MEGMSANLRPSRPEITDTVNAVYDGADGLVLMRETSTGRFATDCVRTTAAIICDAEAGVSASANFGFVRNFTPKPMPLLEAQASNAAKTAIDCLAALIIVMTDTTQPVRLAAKYKPGVPLLVATTTPRVATQCALLHGAVPVVVRDGLDLDHGTLLQTVLEVARRLGLLGDDQGGQGGANEASGGGGGQGSSSGGGGGKVVLFTGPREAPFLAPATFHQSEVTALALGADAAAAAAEPRGYRGDLTIAMRSTKVNLELITSPVRTPRKTKIVCTLGPACWSEEGLAALMDAGMNVARFNFSHGDHAGHKAVLDRVRAVAAAKGKHVATMLDTKGPEIRTAMLRGGANIDIVQGQEVKVVAVGADYATFEGFKDAATGETVIGLSYAKLCQHVKPGGRILLADGSLTLEVGVLLFWPVLCVLLVDALFVDAAGRKQHFASARSPHLLPVLLSLLAAISSGQDDPERPRAARRRAQRQVARRAQERQPAGRARRPARARRAGRAGRAGLWRAPRHGPRRGQLRAVRRRRALRAAHARRGRRAG